MKTYLKYVGITLLGIFGMFLVFGLPDLVAYLIWPKSQLWPMAMLFTMLAGMFLYLCYILGDALWSWKQGTIDQWGL